MDESKTPRSIVRPDLKFWMTQHYAQFAIGSLTPRGEPVRRSHTKSSFLCGSLSAAVNLYGLGKIFRSMFARLDVWSPTWRDILTSAETMLNPIYRDTENTE